MPCTEFLERYTDFRDGLMSTPRELRRFSRHVAQCAACRRYDAAVRRGVSALQAAETIEPSPEFRRRLDARRAREPGAPPAVPARAGVAAAPLGAAPPGVVRAHGAGAAPAGPAPVLPPARLLIEA